MGDAGIIRNRLKIQAAIVNAQAFLRIRKKPGDFSNYILLNKKIRLPVMLI
jgi:DNA-3-methyladenine glycosylase I